MCIFGCSIQKFKSKETYMRGYRKSRQVMIAFALISVGVPALAQNVSWEQDHLLRAREASQLTSQVGVIEAFQPILRDVWSLPLYSEEALYLDAVARQALGTSEAELQLLKFIEDHPHSAYLPYAQSRLGEWYYVRGQYGSAVHWFRRVDTSLLPEQMSMAVDYYHAYALMREGRDAEALRIFQPLTHTAEYRQDARFYAGYLSMKSGDIPTGLQYLRQVTSHPAYGMYADAYIAEGLLSTSKYTEALSTARAAMDRDPALSSAVEQSLLRSAGLAAAALGQQDTSTEYLRRYMTVAPQPGRVEMLTLGKNLFDLGQSGEAVGYLERVDTGQADFMSQLSNYYRGLCLLSSKNSSAALTAFDKAASIGVHAPLTEVATFNAALAAYSKAPGRVGDGSRRLIQFLAQYDRSEFRPRVIGHLSDAFLNERDNALALRELDKIKPLPSELSRIRERVRLGQANKALASGNTGVASRQYDEIISAGVDPSSVAQAHLWKGEAAYRDGNYQEAIRSTREYLRVRPQDQELNPNAYYTLGYALFNRQDYNGAEEALRQFLSAKTNATANERTSVLNRLGDIAIQRKSYATASDYFAQAQQAGGDEADYAHFTRGQVLGLQKDYKGKAAVLAQLASRYPGSPHAAEALLEQGRSLALLGDQKGAREAFGRFNREYPSSPLAPKAEIELAQSYFNDSDLTEASRHYENVIRRYPKSDEAKTALQDLKSISVQLNRVDQFNDLLRQTGASASVSDTEMDSLAYLAAERAVAQDSKGEGLKALDKYLQQYPNGAFVNRAAYSKSLILYNSGNYSDAALILERLGDQTAGPIAKDAYHLLGVSYDKMLQPGRAAEAFLKEAHAATTITDRSEAVRLAVDRAVQSGSEDFIYGLASDIARGQIEVNDQAKAFAYGYAGEAYAKANRKDAALKYADRVLALPDQGKHTMAKVVKALDMYDKANYIAVQKSMNTLTAQGSTDAYWLARGFVLLADTYTKLGDKTSARTYLEGIQSSYPNSSDGIMQMVNERLEKLK